MNNLKINGVIKSNELVNIINTFRKEEGKSELQHDNFIKKIRKEIESLKLAGITSGVNFNVAKYSDKQGKERECFELTHDGMLEMLNSESAYCRYKTIEYINNLQAQIEQPKKATCIEDLIIAQAQSVKALKEDVQALKEGQAETQNRINSLSGAINLNADNWRKDTTILINKMAANLGGFQNIKPLRKESYKLLENDYGVKLNVRLLNKLKNMALKGCGRSRICKTNYLDVIAEDKKLINGYISIVGKMAVKYGIKEALNNETFKK